MENQSTDSLLQGSCDNFLKAHCTAAQAFMQQQRLESLGLIVGEVAHDLNNIFSMILGHTELLEEDLRKQNIAVPDRLENMLTAINSGSGLCRSMLTYAGKMTTHNTSVDLVTIIEEMQRLFRVMVPHSISFTCNITPPIPLVNADPIHIRQIVSNLLLNASDALQGENGSINLHVKTHTETQNNTMGNTPPGQYACIIVEDNGCGMDPATKANLFTPFFTTKLTGRGLGMSSVAHLVQGMQGSLCVETEQGVGTTFTLLLPAAINALPDRAKTKLAEPCFHLSGTILLVDDEEHLCKIGLQTLQKTGATVITVCNGKDALEYFREHSKEIDLVLLDVMMPDINGCEVCKAMHQIKPEANVVLISGFTESDLAKQLTAITPSDILTKPVSTKQLRQTAARFLSIKEDCFS